MWAKGAKIWSFEALIDARIFFTLLTNAPAVARYTAQDLKPNLQHFMFGLPSAELVRFLRLTGKQQVPGKALYGLCAFIPGRKRTDHADSMTYVGVVLVNDLVRARDRPMFQRHPEEIPSRPGHLGSARVR